MDKVATKTNKVILYKEVAIKLESFIKSHRLSPGIKLPSVRKFATLFNTSHFTVYNALEELKGNGIIESKPKKGYFVSSSGWDSLFKHCPDWNKIMDKGWLSIRGTEAPFFKAQYENTLSTYGISEHFGALKYLSEAASMSSSSNMPNDLNVLGSLRLRNTICERMKRYGVFATPDEVLITNGTFHSMTLIKHAFMRPGMYFACDNVFSARNNTLFSSLGINKIQMPLDRFGMRLDVLKQVIAKYKNSIVASLFGTINPYADDSSCGLMPLNKRKELLTICRASRVPVIDADIFRDILSPEAPLPVKAFDNSELVIYLGALTKTFNSNFRLGWIIATKDIVVKLADLRLQLEGQHNLLTQNVADNLLSTDKGGLYDEWLKEFKPQLENHRKIGHDIIKHYLSNIATITNASTPTLITFMKFIDEIDTRAMYQNRNALQFTPGFVLDDEYLQYVGFYITALTPPRMEELIKALSELAKKHIITK